MNISLTASTEWEGVPGACQQCSTCHEPVYGNAFQLVVKFPKVNGEVHTAEVKDCFLCESCFEVIKRG